MEWAQFWTVGLIALILGGIIGMTAFPVKVEVEKIKEVPVEKIVNQTVEKIIEVPAPSLLDLAVKDFMIFVEDEEDEAGTENNLLGKYDFEDISVNKVYDAYTVEYNDDGYVITFNIKLKYKEEGEASEKILYKVIMKYETGEDTELISAEDITPSTE